MKTFKALVKREYWENRGSMLVTPIVMTLFFAASSILALITANHIVVDGEDLSLLNKIPQLIEHLDGLSERQRDIGVQIGLYMPMALFGFVMFLVTIFYSLGSLYDERKDRSILFWKSLPISDSSTVLSKFVAATLVYPVFYFIALVAFQIYSLLLGTVILWFGGSSGTLLWGSSNLFAVIFNSFCGLLVLSLWLAPIWGWLMFASVWAKSKAFLWGTLPIALIAIAEGTIFNSTHFIEMVGKHIAKGFIVSTASINNLEGEGIQLGLDLTHPLQAFTITDFWVGLAVAAAFLAGSIYIRRFRDES